MAILTSPLTDRRGQSSQTGQPTERRRSLVVEWLGHPQASFFLVLAPTVLLLVLGAVMVLSASSVYAQVQFDDAYYFVRRHAIFLVLGGIAAWVLATSSVQRLKILGWLAVVGAAVLQLLTFTSLGWAKNGNKNWVELGALGRIQPSEFAKLAIVLWGADLLSRKYNLLHQPKHLLIPFVPVSGLLIGLVILQRDLGTGMVLGAIRLGVPVIELDIDRELGGFADSSYDVVVLSRTIQTVRYPDRVLRHMARIADRLIVSVPNFGWYRHRLRLLTGRLPMGKDLPYSWYDSPNLRYTTLHDLQLLFDKVGLVVERSIPLNAAGDPLRLPGSGNLLASSAVYVLRPDKA